LATAFRCRRIDPCRNQPLDVLAPLVRVGYVNSLVTILVLLFRASVWSGEPLGLKLTGPNLAAGLFVRFALAPAIQSTRPDVG